MSAEQSTITHEFKEAAHRIFAAFPGHATCVPTRIIGKGTRVTITHSEEAHGVIFASEDAAIELRNRTNGDLIACVYRPVMLGDFVLRRDNHLQGICRIPDWLPPLLHKIAEEAPCLAGA